MAAGMTLNQLYAPSTTASGAGSVPTMSSVAAATSTPPQGRSPKPDNVSDAKPSSLGLQSQMDRVYQMPYTQQQPPPQYAPQYPSNTMQYAPLSKAGPSTSEDYAADPLPFEYRKFQPQSTRDDVGSLSRGSASIVTSTAQHYADSYAPHPVYPPPPARLSPYAQQQYTEPRSQPYHHEMQPHFPRSSQPMYNPMPSNMLPLPGHSFPPLLDHSVVTKKEVEPYAQSQAYGADMTGPRGAMTTTGTAQEAMIKVKTPLKLKYWRNGRRNLQCFPSCKVFGDYSAIKIEDLKQHDFMWGKCRGSLVTEVTLNSNVTFDDLVLLGRVHSIENIPVAFEEAVIRECMLGSNLEVEKMDSMKDTWITGERLPDFVQQDSNVACFEFKPKVWKYTEDMAQGKCKRRNVKYYVQFEAFVQVMNGDHRYYACIGSGMSTSFEVGSSRVLARQKRKAASNAPDAAKKAAQAAEASAMQSAQQQSMMPHNSNPQLMHNMMSTHPMSNQQMYAPSAFHHDNQNRGLPPTFPHPQVMMNQMPPQQQMQPEMHYSMPPPQQQQQLTPPQLQPQQPQPQSLSVGEKRKMSSERPAFPTDRSNKMLKPMSGVPQSVPI